MIIYECSMGFLEGLLIFGMIYGVLLQGFLVIHLIALLDFSIYFIFSIFLTFSSSTFISPSPSINLPSISPTENTHAVSPQQNSD